MSAYFASQSHMPCAECGASVRRAPATSTSAIRAPARLSTVQLREEVEAFDDALRGYLDLGQGRFAQWLAERARRRGCSL